MFFMICEFRKRDKKGKYRHLYVCPVHFKKNIYPKKMQRKKSSSLDRKCQKKEVS